MRRKPALGSPEWLRTVPARWGLRQVDACRVMGIAPRTYRAKVAGELAISERLVGRIVQVEMALARGDVPFGWPVRAPLPDRLTLQLSPRTIDHLRAILARHDEPEMAAAGGKPLIIYESGRFCRR